MFCVVMSLLVNVDFEVGYVGDVEGVFGNVLMVIEIGVVGLLIEDCSGCDLLDVLVVVE